MTIFFLGDQDIDPRLVARFGGKAANLHQLKIRGFNVPSAFIIDKCYEDLESWIEKIGGYPVAVRSSCSLEDLSNASFAGLYETYLNVGNKVDLILKIKECFDSVNSPRVQDYLQNKGLSSQSHPLVMNILVQKMVEPKISGVLFTLNPINGFEEEFYLEFCDGLGERLVSGHVTPSSVQYDIKSKNILNEFINSESTHIEIQVLKELIVEAQKIQAFFGTPQDIEWVIDKNSKLHILQSRPITTFHFRTDVPEMTNADLKDGGISARVCTPFMFSAYRNALQFSMGDYFKKICLIHNPDEVKWIDSYYGRVYWNAEAVKQGLKLIPGYNEEDFDRDLGIQKDYGIKGPVKTDMSFSSLIHAIPVIMGLSREFSDCEIMVDQFRDQFSFRDQGFKNDLVTLPKMTMLGFRQWFSELLQFQLLTEQNYFRTIYNNSNFQSEFKTSLKKMKGYVEGDELELMGQLNGVSHLDVQVDLELLTKKADFYGFDSDSYYSQREIFLSIHYHHGPAELDLTVPRWGEKKEWVDDLVRAFIPTQSRSSLSYDDALRRIEFHLNFFSKSRFRKSLARSRNFLLIREEMRSYSTRAYYLLRKAILELGRRIDVPERLVFMLDLTEIQKMLSSGDFTLPDLEERYLHYQGYRNFKAPNDFGGTIIQPTHSMSENSLRGIGCSPGEIVGRARVILDIHETHQLTKEDILVTQFTDPGWTPVLARVGGVVTEVGGLLSHAAVIGREYGIPAILNVGLATTLIKDGMLIRINGKSGMIEILEESSK